jgi:uncharacterized protein (DUF2267 family)
VDHEQFVTIVQERSGLDRTGAERAIRATLETLSERLSQDRAEDLRYWLPEPIRQWVIPSMVVHFDVQEFLRRVAIREFVDLSTAEGHLRAVFHALGHALPPLALTALEAELPQDFRPLVEYAARDWVDYMPTEEFVRRVAERTGLDPETARRTTEVVLEALAEHVSGRDVERFLGKISIELHAPLLRGVEKSRGAPRQLSLDEFLNLVAEREGTSREEARDHVRAVLVTLREAAGEEFSHVAAGLPSQFKPLLVAGH